LVLVDVFHPDGFPKQGTGTFYEPVYVFFFFSIFSIFHLLPKERKKTSFVGASNFLLFRKRGFAEYG
jgi:hypothetical protein